MSAYLDALLASAKADEVPAAQMVENLIIAAIQDLPLVLPAQYQPLVQGLDLAILPVIKGYLDAQVAKLQPPAQA